MSLLREPLVHFFLLGAALFVLVALTRDVDQERPDRIVVSAARIERLSAVWERTWRRPPTVAELDRLIEDFIDEEVLYREALALGLDEDDTIIRRRLRQKMEFVAQDVAPPVEPTDDALLARLAAHPDDYRLPARFSFVHVYFSPDRRGVSIEDDAAAALARLSGAEPVPAETLGDPLTLPAALEDIDAREIDRMFGQGFVEQLGSIDIGTWAGPVESGFGLHLVRLDAYAPARMPRLDEIRERVRQDWLADRHEQQQRAFVAALRARYDISVEDGRRGPERSRPKGAAAEDQ